ncbi:60S ribosomal protein L1, mitochondrial precursor [Neurospora crassa]|uniref:Large ribosomal subunit protein uL1m n=2 Tax=Neurospora crassa TaxID=5141 RepID=RM01_NEUCR|nr:mitochondrial 54S ribosomal protein MRPL1 [Neurospora crassa OR74A]Q1K699.1 RecName: Full=Large ribosomal subunit protein uL1m [Neurospora crassa OR74A]6YWE_e Chain e, 60S ribosomal protein L1, mitochondrial [Neurospora crassa]6YWS_e Chain e, 60S ribosomal protein L1 [Neurospora crassa OR74A]6YWX_e Chain e, 60S ribosomal protein L1 [Neurospora crassa OR74A]6YWY_e Chain e, 60S ribosomal protein L1, mitochondrial [Neurospora crassa]EAA29595.1 60S ribosomal protein L1 [Neurospora crassa OR74A|eukprot:XP_958831.1 mitochondrial 54S ribosomal protein MRPL1 [Neurospora crassa OR74A]
MASTQQCLASLARLSLSTPTRAALPTIPKFLVPSVAASQVRYATNNPNKGGAKKAPKKKKQYKFFKSWDLTGQQQFSLCDAMRYLRAVEVGQPPLSVKYEVHVKLRTKKNGPVVRDRVRLPTPVKTDTRIAVICPEGSALQEEAKNLGAVMAGEETLFEAIRSGNFPFNKLLCHTESEGALRKANVGKLLGPKGLMPSGKTKTITNNLEATFRDMIGMDEYRERNGVVRMAVGQLGFTPKQLAENIRVFMAKIKSDIGKLDDTTPKMVEEVVLSTTHGPGMSLNAEFAPTDDKIKPEDLESVM